MYRQQSSASGDCYPCDAGTYAPFEQASVCLDCPRGYYSDSGGAVACSPCPAGTAGANIAGGALADACVDCSAGGYSEEAGLTACEQCPAGTASATVGAGNSEVCQVGVGSVCVVASVRCREGRGIEPWLLDPCYFDGSYEVFGWRRHGVPRVGVVRGVFFFFAILADRCGGLYGLSQCLLIMTRPLFVSC